MAKPGFVPKRISDLLVEVAAISDCNVKFSKLTHFLDELQQEKRKIDAFKRELPLCMLLLDDAIVLLMKESRQCAASEDKKQQPVLEEFIPMKRVDEEDERGGPLGKEEMADTKDKRDWLSSVQLWNSPENSSTDPKGCTSVFQREELKTEYKIDKPTQIGIEGIFQGPLGRAAARSFLPFKAFNVIPGKEGGKREELPVHALLSHGIKHQREESGSLNLVVPPPEIHLPPHLGGSVPRQSGPPRKQRRCWSSELHSRFCKALDQLGGCHVATPKQIRELMQIDGLTNDEVKSHLQKYRLHTRRVHQTSSPTRSSQSTVVLGGLWKSQEGDSSRGASSQFGSPVGPLQLSANGGTHSMEDDDDDDIASECYSWMSRLG